MEIRHSVVILTKDNNHHWYFISELAKVANVKAIIIDQPKKSSIMSKIRKHGFGWTVLKLLAKFRRRSSYDVKSELKKYRPNFDVEKSKHTYGHLVRKVGDINSEDTTQFIRKIAPDYICSLGGGLIKKEGISLASIGALNLHSGISPFYNGADMIDKVIESRNLNFIGCTLMFLSHQIDAGPILAHHLTSIEVNDSANSLFCKTILGGIKIYTDFLVSEQSILPKALDLVCQKKPMHYCLGYDHTILTDIVKKYFFRRHMTRKFVRDAVSVEYYKNKTDFNELLRVLNVIR